MESRVYFIAYSEKKFISQFLLDYISVIDKWVYPCYVESMC